ncbi:TAXI family TRAP transporter solute-binding subunit, partial [Acinetobacter baumannii]
AAHAAARAINRADAGGKYPVPLHPGAEKYFKEVGVRQ